MIGNGIQDPAGTNTTSVRNTIAVGNGIPSASDFKLLSSISYFGNNMYSTISSFDPNAYQGGNQAPPANLDDLFVSIVATEDLHLESSGHSAIDTGLDLSASFSDDIDAVARPSGAAWDMGADEAPATVPDQVTGLTATAVGSRIDLSWTAPGDGGSAITGYKIERRLCTGTWSTLVAGVFEVSVATVEAAPVPTALIAETR